MLKMFSTLWFSSRSKRCPAILPTGKEAGNALVGRIYLPMIQEYTARLSSIETPR
jgi:hypothetical protein